MKLKLSRKYCSSNLRHVHTPIVHNLGPLKKSQSCMFSVVCIHLVTAKSLAHMLKVLWTGQSRTAEGQTQTHIHLAAALLPRRSHELKHDLFFPRHMFYQAEKDRQTFQHALCSFSCCSIRSHLEWQARSESSQCPKGVWARAEPGAEHRRALRPAHPQPPATRCRRDFDFLSAHVKCQSKPPAEEGASDFSTSTTQAHASAAASAAVAASASAAVAASVNPRPSEPASQPHPSASQLPSASPGGPQRTQ